MANQNDLTASSLGALNQRYEMITHNLANANTIGFKRTRSIFQQELNNRLGGPDSPINGIDSKAHIDFMAGTTVKTDRPLDLTLSGSGFFVLQTPKGPMYTRNGTFNLNSQGQLVDTAGRLVAGDSGPIVVPKNVGSNQIQIGPDGSVLADGKSLGKIKIADFADPQVLRPSGNSTFTAPADAEVKASTATVYQGYQESSNVSVVEELTSLITVTRLYEANLKTVNAGDDRLKTILQVAMG